ncbi:lactate dehydrogenase [Prochlorococcus sp. MIT 1307]|uniref:lactate dehydrogenase n=1 Tax=Prochlorococcus sp. MIT 1307 TaxID=3096219 RepID=UPI002A750AE7|nr:lactate dehydrogenase [Prochlorococcus sp. MIT 1307]
MKAQNTKSKNTDSMVLYSSKYSQKDGQPDRRQQEMKRRFGILQSRRSYLERELKSVKTCLFSLDQQMQRYAAYKQLSIQNEISSNI